METAVATLKPLHERLFPGKPLKSFKVYNDPFGDNELCVELAFVDGEIECLCISPGRPKILSVDLCHEPGLTPQLPGTWASS